MSQNRAGTPSLNAVGAEFDALTELFLGSGVHAPAPTPGTPLRLAEPGEEAAPEYLESPSTESPIRVEALVLGHLPVFGSVWVTPYAKHVAEQTCRPVLLLRIKDSEASLDLITPRTSTSRAHSRVGSVAPREGKDLVSSLRNALPEAGTLLIRVDELSEIDLLSLPTVRAVTILTGSDNPAVIATYHLLKSLRAKLDPEDDRGIPKMLRVAIMGADDEKALGVEQKLRSASDTFLSHAVDEFARVPRVGACSTTAIYRGPACPIGGVLAEVLPPRSTEAAPEPDPEKIAPVGVQEAKPAPEASRPAVAIAPDGAPSRLVPGLIALDVTSPVAPNVEFAIDSEGALHALAMIGSTRNDPAADLLAAASWASSHAGILARLCPGLATTAGERGATLHVLSEDPAVLRPLLDTGLRAHLVVRVSAGGQEIMAAKLLN